MAAPLKPPQRMLADAIIIRLCRGDYPEALMMLADSEETPAALPKLQHNILKHIVQRLQGHQPQLESRIKCESLAEQLKLRGLDPGLIEFVDTQIPPKALDSIYDQAVTMSYENFYKQLEVIQMAEHTIIQNMLILYAHCLKLKMAQQVVDKLNLVKGFSLEVMILYCLAFSMAIYLLTYIL